MITQYLQPYENPFMSVLFDRYGMYGKILGAGQTFFFVFLSMGLILSIVRLFNIPPGGFTLFFVLQAIGASILGKHYIFIATGLLAGSVIDLFYQVLGRRIKDTGALRLFGFLVPLLFFASYTATVLLAYGTWWSIHMVAGSIFAAGATGYLMTFLVVPPAVSS